MLWVLKKHVPVRHAFEHPKHVLKKLIGKKITTIFLSILTYFSKKI